jgi:hypothetical protein
MEDDGKMTAAVRRRTKWRERPSAARRGAGTAMEYKAKKTPAFLPGFFL